MTVRLAAALALALVAQPALALSDDAQARGGSSGSSASAGAQHHSSSGSSQASGGSSGSSSSSSGSSQPQLTDAQRRHPRAGTGTGSHGSRAVYGSPYYRSYYGYPGFYSYYPYDSFYSGFGYYPYAYGYGGYGGGYGYGYRRYRETGSIRLQVDPPETRVYVDGYYAGVVDDFDGIFQRLHVSPGRHEITLKLDGYRTHKFKAYVGEDHTMKVHYDMAKGTGEDAEDVVGDPATVERRAREARGEGRYGYRDIEPSRGRDDDADAEDTPPDNGRLVVDVRPGDASIYVDGEFRGTGRDRISLKLSPGRHRIEVVRPGFRTAEREVDVRAGKTTDLNVELEHS